jgi:ABC-2 type transport system ATP-binding protein
VVADGLGRIYRRKRGSEVAALTDLSLEIPQGEIHGLLGPNGAGKTTFCKILSTVLLPTVGSATVFGHDVVQESVRVRPLLGLVFGGERGLYGRLTARQNLRYWAALYLMPDSQGRRRTDFLLDRVGLSGDADVPVETFSRGMKQRLHLARGLIGTPRLMLLDEPTVGLDPVAALDFRQLLGELLADGMTILLTTHDMDEAEAVCHRVTLIDKGRVLTTETPRRLVETAARYRWVEADETPPAATNALAGLDGVVDVQSSGGLRVKVTGDDAAQRVVNLLIVNGARSVRVVPPRLEDVYLDIIGDRGMGIEA